MSSKYIGPRKRFGFSMLKHTEYPNVGMINYENGDFEWYIGEWKRGKNMVLV